MALRVDNITHAGVTPKDGGVLFYTKNRKSSASYPRVRGLRRREESCRFQITAAILGSVANAPPRCFILLHNRSGENTQTRSSTARTSAAIETRSDTGCILTLLCSWYVQACTRSWSKRKKSSSSPPVWMSPSLRQAHASTTSFCTCFSGFDHRCSSFYR